MTQNANTLPTDGHFDPIAELWVDENREIAGFNS